MIFREGLRRPGDYREVFEVLREAGIIETDLGRRLEEMASFRNRLVHGYLDIEPGRLYEIARKQGRRPRGIRFWDARLIGARNGKRGHSPGQRTSANGRPVYCTERIARTGK